MRKDALGLFWQDHEKLKAAPKAVEKRTPPARTWEDAGYLPGLEEALRFDVPLFTWEELFAAAINREEMLWDLEVYPNYFLAAFCSYKSGKVIYCEGTPDNPLDIQKLRWLMETFTTVGFNSISFDMPIAAMALAGCTNAQLKQATNMIILDGMQRQDVLKHFKVKKLKGCDHIDLIEVAPLRASLKIYGGRLHAPKMQDLPFHPETILSADQIAIVRYYCVNDLTTTGFLRKCLDEAVQLRVQMSQEYQTDLRSKSDAQIAEVVIADAVGRMNGYRPQRPTIEVGTAYHYDVPAFLQYKSPLMKWVLEQVRQTAFVVGEHGSINLPQHLADMEVRIADGVYRMGIGGLHSSEKTASWHTNETHSLHDFDVVSFYPKIIINQGLYPEHLGRAFLHVFSDLVDRRIAAKAAGRKGEANSRKIIINGTYGKLGSKYSILYAPKLLIQTTLTGQLVLLMLIERMEMAGIRVVSANTDGIVLHCPRELHATMHAIVKQWERDTNIETEETKYAALYSRDVNNYIAIKPDGTTKNKGAFFNPWTVATKDPTEKLKKNPASQIAIEAVEAFLIKQVAICDTIKAATDVRKFVSVRTVKGGAVQVGTDVPVHDTPEQLLALMGYVEIEGSHWTRKGASDRTAMTRDDAYQSAYRDANVAYGGRYLGKAVRWYYSTEKLGEMVYADSGNKVARSDGACPLLTLPQALPQDVDFDWYEREAFDILSDLGYSAGSLSVNDSLQPH